MNADIEREPSAGEILKALNDMHPMKVSGPYRMHALFYKKFSNVVWEDVLSFVKQAWLGEVNFKSVNLTNIILTPKVKDSTSMAQFRPINLYHVLYKILSKTLTSRNIS